MQPKTGAASACGCDRNPEASAGAGPGVGSRLTTMVEELAHWCRKKLRRTPQQTQPQQKQLIDSPVFKDIRTCSYWKRWYVFNHNFYKVPTLNPQARLQSSPIHLLIFAHKHQ